MPDPAARAILFYCQGMYELQRMLRMRAALSERGWIPVVATQRLSIWLSARRARLACELLRAPVRRDRLLPPLPETPERRLGLLSDAEITRFQHSAWDAFERMAARAPVRAMGQWNGLRLGGQVATAFALTHGLATVYFEIGNLEPKTFIDPVGVNAASALAAHPEILDRYPLSDAEVEAWRAGFIARRRGVTAIPQQRGVSRVNPWYPVDWLGAELLGIPQPAPFSVRKRLEAKLRLWRRPQIPRNPPPAEPYVFLPLQVSTDTNLLLFAEHDNLSAIAFAANLARRTGRVLVVKTHPGEQDTRLLAEVIAVCAREGHVITSANTAELILGASEVVTINSTVGLEARLMDRPVTILGRSLYERFSVRQAVAYATRHLIDFDPFGQTPLDAEGAGRIAALLEAHLDPAPAVSPKAAAEPAV